MPRVSIGLPVYNGAEYLEHSVRSVLDQDYRDLELIVADNASTDGSVEIVEKLAADDDRVVLLRSDENRGAAWNYNRVLAAASGELFRWHAHDDWFEPGLLSALVTALDQHPDAVLAHSWTKFVDVDGAETVFVDDLGATSASPAQRLGSVIRRLTYCNAVFGLIRRDELDGTARIASFPGSDVPLLYELSMVGTFAVVPEALYSRRPGNSIKSNPTTKQLAAWFGPSTAGSRFPWFHHWKASMVAIWRRDASARDKLAMAAVFHRYWPVEYLRRHVRRARRRRG